MRFKGSEDTKLFAIVIALALIFALPLLNSNDYFLHVCIIALLTAIPALGLRLILSTGHLSLGQAVFSAAGAYTSVTLVGRLGVSFWVALPIAGVVAALLAVLVGWPSLRLKGAYFSVLTFGLGEALRLLLLNFWEFSGGPSGIPGGETSIKVIPTPNPIALPFTSQVISFDSKMAYYYLALVLLLITVFVLHRIHTSRTGVILQSIEQSESLAISVGINVTQYRLLSFTTACFFTGMAGACMAHYLQSITPQDYGFVQSANIVIYAIIGGRASTLGPIVGAVSMIVLSSAIGFLQQYQSIVFGALSIVILLVLPNGLVSLPDVLIRRLRQAGQARDEVPATAGTGRG